METLRRVANGTMAEYIPESFFVDRLSRTLGFSRLGKQDWKNADETQQKLVKSYTNGINAFLRSKYFARTPEMRILWMPEPEEWNPEQVCAIMRLMSWQTSHGWYSKLVNTAVQSILSSNSDLSDSHTVFNKVVKNIQTFDDNDANVLKTGKSEINSLNWDELKKHLSEAPSSDQGSNAWVVSGKHTDTGKPILAADPHLNAMIPCLWFENHLSCPSVDVIGSSIPGLPYVFIGHNKATSWAFTMSYVDVTDVYIEKIHENKWYDYDGASKPIQVFEEIIKVQGELIHRVEEVKVTDHGPIISNVLDYTQDHTLSIQATFLKPAKNLPIAALYDVNKALTWEEFHTAVQGIEILSWNFLYADVHDNIGYILSGNVPERKKKAIEQVNIALNGWESATDWKGLYDRSQNPKLLNPKSGYIVSANQRIADSNHSQFLGHSFKHSSRSKRISNVLAHIIQKKHRKIQIKDCMKLQNDVIEADDHLKFIKPLVNVSSHFDEFTKVSQDLRHEKRRREESGEPLKPTDSISFDHVMECLSELSHFDGRCSTDSSTASLYVVFQDKLLTKILEELLRIKTDKDSQLTLQEHEINTKKIISVIKGAGLSSKVLPQSEYASHDSLLVEELIHTLKQITSTAVKSRERLVYEAMADTIVRLRELIPESINNTDCRKEVESYHYGKIHTLTFKSNLSSKTDEYNKGPYKIGGTAHTVNSNTHYGNDDYSVSVYPSYRIIVDLNDPETNSYSILAPGQSGNHSSSHYGDLIDKFLNGEYNKMLYRREDILKDKEGIVVLSC
jgi:penicillin amidase